MELAGADKRDSPKPTRQEYILRPIYTGDFCCDLGTIFSF
jgi:hypothetical protein